MLANGESLIFYIFIAILAILAFWLVRLERKINRLLSGRNAKSLEELIVGLGRDVKITDQTNEEIKKHLINMEERLRRSIQHVKTIRFNPFRDQGQGGTHSFAAAFLDERGNGTVISSLYARDKVSVYAKPITARRSEHELSAEEKQAIAR